MSNLTFANLQSEVYAHTGLDSTDATNQANVTRWLNYVQNDILARYSWPFMENRETIVTTPDYLTGTVSISFSGTTVTGSGTNFTSNMANGQFYIQFSGFNDWYQISTYSNSTTIGIALPYVQSSDAINIQYTIRQFLYSLSSAADR